MVGSGDDHTLTLLPLSARSHGRLLQAPGFHDYVSSDAELWQAPLQRTLPLPTPLPPPPPPASLDTPQSSPRWLHTLSAHVSACHTQTLSCPGDQCLCLGLGQASAANFASQDNWRPQRRPLSRCIAAATSRAVAAGLPGAAAASDASISCPAAAAAAATNDSNCGRSRCAAGCSGHRAGASAGL